jgi:hypothetical protein
MESGGNRGVKEIEGGHMKLLAGGPMGADGGQSCRV